MIGGNMESSEQVKAEYSLLGEEFEVEMKDMGLGEPLPEFGAIFLEHFLVQAAAEARAALREIGRIAKDEQIIELAAKGLTQDAFIA
jgi:hypothetical protein